MHLSAREENKKRELWKGVAVYAVLAAVFTALTSVLNMRSLWEAVTFWAFQVFGIMTPGLMFVFLFRLPLHTDMEILGVGYALGYVSNIVLYFCIVPWGLKDYTGYFVIGLAVISLLYMGFGKRFGQKAEHDRFGCRLCIIVGCVLTAVQLCAYTGVNMLVPLAARNSYYSDVLYWIGNIVELSKEFPVIDFRNWQSLRTYNYHYFSSLQLALINLATGIRPVVLGFVYSVFEAAVLVVTGSYLVFYKCAGEKKSYIAFAMIALLFTTGAEKLTNVTYTAHMLIGPFGFDVGMGFLLFCIYFMLRLLARKQFSVKMGVMILIFLITLLGVKSPNAVILLCGIGFLFLYWLVKERKYWVLILGGILLGIVAFLCLKFFNLKYYIPNGDISLFLGDYEGNSTLVFLLKAVTFPVYLILCQPAVYISFFAAMVYRIVKKKRKDVWSWICVGSVCVAGILGNCLEFFGHSEIYFVMSSYPFAIVYVLRTLKGIKPAKSRRRKKKAVWLKAAAAVLTAFGIVMALIGYDEIGLGNYLLSGLQRYIDRENWNGFGYSANTLVTRELNEAYEYLRLNTPEDTPVMSNRYGMAEGVFSERYIIYDWEVKKMIADDDSYNLWQYCKDMGIYYLMVTAEDEVENDSAFELKEEFGEKVVENESVRIWHLY